MYVVLICEVTLAPSNFRFRLSGLLCPRPLRIPPKNLLHLLPVLLLLRCHFPYPVRARLADLLCDLSSKKLNLTNQIMVSDSEDTKAVTE